MRAFLVDPGKRTVEQVEHSGELADMRASIGCQWLEAVRLPGDAVMFMDEEGKLGDRVRTDLFHIPAPAAGRTWDVVGRALIFGIEGDREIDAPFTLAEVQGMVRFLDMGGLVRTVIEQAAALTARGICCCAHSKDPARFPCICPAAQTPPPPWKPCSDACDGWHVMDDRVQACDDARRFYCVDPNGSRMSDDDRALAYVYGLAVGAGMDPMVAAHDVEVLEHLQHLRGLHLQRERALRGWELGDAGE